MWGGMCIDATAQSKEPQQAESWPETSTVLQQVGNCRCWGFTLGGFVCTPPEHLCHTGFLAQKQYQSCIHTCPGGLNF